MEPSQIESDKIGEKVWEEIVQNQQEIDVYLRNMRLLDAWKLWKQRVEQERALRMNIKLKIKKNN